MAPPPASRRGPIAAWHMRKRPGQVGVDVEIFFVGQLVVQADENAIAHFEFQPVGFHHRSAVSRLDPGWSGGRGAAKHGTQSESGNEERELNFHGASFSFCSERDGWSVEIFYVDGIRQVADWVAARSRGAS